MSIRCLVVEDEYFTRDVLSLTLRRANIETDVVESGESALTYLESHHPDVVIVDLHMPNVNGYDVINSIRSNSMLQDVMIIIMTANPSAINSPEARKADAFLTKPLDIKRMIDLIHQGTSVRK